ECGDADRPGDRRTPYGAHNESGAVHPGDGAGHEHWRARGWVAAGYLADRAGSNRPGFAKRDDRGRLAAGVGVDAVRRASETASTWETHLRECTHGHCSQTRTVRGIDRRKV